MNPGGVVDALSPLIGFSRVDAVELKSPTLPRIHTEDFLPWGIFSGKIKIEKLKRRFD